jgi:hypothetical protein
MARFSGNPYVVFGARPVREKHLRSYIHLQHRSGRSLAESLHDDGLDALGGTNLVWKVLMNPDTIRALAGDVRDELEAWPRRV